jgi:hypothetical protein
MITNRVVVESDFPTIEKEVRADACHRDWLKPAFFTEKDTQSVVYEDESGPILFARLSSALRIHIQFCDVEKERTRRCLITQFSDIVKRARENGYKQIVFETESPTLKWFCHRYLGFSNSPHEQVLWLSTPTETK